MSKSNMIRAVFRPLADTRRLGLAAGRCELVNAKGVKRGLVEPGAEVFVSEGYFAHVNATVKGRESAEGGHLPCLRRVDDNGAVEGRELVALDNANALRERLDEVEASTKFRPADFEGVHHAKLRKAAKALAEANGDEVTIEGLDDALAYLTGAPLVSLLRAVL